jgi:signal transduction histidine kinase/CheY-like chemotaxis protein
LAVSVSREIETRPRVVRTSTIYIFEIAIVAFVYFWLVKFGLTLASVHPSASAVWPATGFALAILLLRGCRIWPAIFLGAWLGNISSIGSIYTASAIALGNSIEAIVGASLTNRWSGGVRTLTTPAGIVKFALISTAATGISPAIGVSSLSFGGYAEWARFGSIFTTWWLGDLAGALMVAPVIVLWSKGLPTRAQASETIAIFFVSAAIGLIAFSPIVDQTVSRAPLAFLAFVPLVWSALRGNPHDTTLAAFILSAFAVWGTSAGGGPFSWAGFDDSFVLLITFIVSAAIPSLMLSTMAAQLQDSHSTLERKVAERTHQLELANLAKSRLIAVASHDLRQPLHALRLFVAQLRERPDDTQQNRIIEQIDTAVDSMNELFNNLLDISKLDSGVLVPNIFEFPIASVFRKIKNTFVGVAREKRLSFRIISSDAWVRSDPILLERILLNLVSNAVRYTREGGVVLGCRKRGERLHIEIWDTGPGIPENERQRIFGEFYRLPDRQRDDHTGLGLGLAIVQRLCGLLHHSVELSSVVDKGSVFRVIVPRVSAQADRAEPMEAGYGDVSMFSGKFVVVIDDDGLVLDSMGGLLRTWGCDVVESTSDELVLTTLAEYDRPPDLIICDYRLSRGRTGIQAITRLREALNVFIPAIIISGDTDPEQLRQVRASGYPVLHKPVSPRALRAMLIHIFKKRVADDPSPIRVRPRP